MSGASAGMAAWKLAFQLSPIILSNGLVNSFPGKMLPIVGITEILNFPLGLLSGGSNVGLDNFFANFQPVPGTSVISQEVAKYPFANSTIAANATITMPLQVSMLMVCPVRNAFGYYERLPLIMGMVEAFKRHNAAGGTYTVVTPSYIYTNCIMREMRDASSLNTKQPQHMWQLDFEKPLLTVADAEQAQNGLMSMITNGIATGLNPVWEGLQTAAQIPASLAGVSQMPAQVSSLAANTATSSGMGLLGPI